MFNKIREFTVTVWETDEATPAGFQAMCTKQGPDRYAIIWPAGISEEQQKKNIRHELGHIWARDLDGSRSADAAEAAQMI